MEYAGLKYREKGGATKAGAHSSYKSFMSLNCPQTLPLRKVPHFHLSEKKTHSSIHPSILNLDGHLHTPLTYWAK